MNETEFEKKSKNNQEIVSICGMKLYVFNLMSI